MTAEQLRPPQVVGADGHVLSDGAAAVERTRAELLAVADERVLWLCQSAASELRAGSDAADGYLAELALHIKGRQLLLPRQEATPWSS